MNQRPGKFLREIEVEDVVFIASLPTVGQYMDIVSRGIFKGKVKDLYAQLALACVVGWRGVVDEYGNVVEFSTEVLKYDIPSSYKILVGQELWNNYTTLDDETVEYYKGYIRFIYYLSDDKHKEQAKYYSCKTCIEAGAWRSKGCGKTEEFRKQIQRELGIEEEERRREKERTGKTVFNMAEFKKRYGSKRTNKGRVRLKPPETPNSGAEKAFSDVKIVLNRFKYPECPVSWIPDVVKEWGDKLYFCSKSEIPFFSGGLADQPNQIFEIQKVIQSESNKIEGEAMKAASKNA